MLFPTQTLSQIVEMIDSGLLFGPDTPPDRNIDRIVDVLATSLASYPAVIAQDFSILYGFREREGLKCSFSLRAVAFRHRSTPVIEVLQLPSYSDVVAVLGSGKDAFEQSMASWKNSEVSRTSRSVFSALADSLHEGRDQASGGPPQLVGLYRKGGGQAFGVIWGEKHFYYGTEVKSEEPATTVKWHNNLFEICDPDTLDRRLDAQPQPRPRSLEKKPI